MNGRGVMARTRNASKALAHCVPKLVYNCLANKAETDEISHPTAERMKGRKNLRKTAAMVDRSTELAASAEAAHGV